MYNNGIKAEKAKKKEESKRQEETTQDPKKKSREGECEKELVCGD